MRERDIERVFVRMVRQAGGMALKFISPGCNGMPDRLVLLPDGKLAFVELKAPGRTMRPLQEKRKRQLEALGFFVFCLDGTDQIGAILHEIQTS